MENVGKSSENGVEGDDFYPVEIYLADFYVGRDLAPAGICEKMTRCWANNSRYTGGDFIPIVYYFAESVFRHINARRTPGIRSTNSTAPDDRNLCRNRLNASEAVIFCRISYASLQFWHLEFRGTMSAQMNLCTRPRVSALLCGLKVAVINATAKSHWRN